ncbi:MAG: hypothetical protein WKF58_15045 [Ilumatobacteraceae bacterium]
MRRRCRAIHASTSTSTPTTRRPRSSGWPHSELRAVDWDGYGPDSDFVVLEDTEGNRFCVIDAAGHMDAWTTTRTAT